MLRHEFECDMGSLVGLIQKVVFYKSKLEFTTTCSCHLYCLFSSTPAYNIVVKLAPFAITHGIYKHYVVTSVVVPGMY